MKIPFRQQATNFDCAPTSIINGLKYLFDRKDIPPFVLKRIYKDCLDIEAFRGTSSGAMHDIAHWLNAYRERLFKQFAVKTQFIRGRQVHLRHKSKILRCIEDGGAALLCVHVSKRTWHYITCIHAEGDWLYCYDPAPPSKRSSKQDYIECFAEARGQQPNVRIRSDWLDREISKDSSHDECIYVFGDYENRESLLLNRISD